MIGRLRGKQTIGDPGPQELHMFNMVGGDSEKVTKLDVHVSGLCIYVFVLFTLV